MSKTGSQPLFSSAWSIAMISCTAMLFFATDGLCNVAEDIWWKVLESAWVSGVLGMLVFQLLRRERSKKGFASFLRREGEAMVPIEDLTGERPSAFDLLKNAFSRGSLLGVVLFCAALWSNEAWIDSPPAPSRVLILGKGTRTYKNGRGYWMRIQQVDTGRTFVVRRSVEYGLSFGVGTEKSIYFQKGRFGWLVPLG